MVKHCYFIFVFVLLSIVLSSCFSVKSTTKFQYEKISPERYKSMLQDSSNYYLIDVRTKGEYKKAHISKAENKSYLSFRYGKKVDTLDRSKLVFVYCQTCHRSPLAARRMKHKGFRKVYDLKGGLQRWE